MSLTKFLSQRTGDAVFGHAAETGHDALIQPLFQCRPVTYRPVDRARASGFDLEAFGADHRPFHQQVMGGVKPAGPMPATSTLSPL